MSGCHLAPLDVGQVYLFCGRYFENGMKILDNIVIFHKASSNSSIKT